jgi:hypothetical protein
MSKTAVISDVYWLRSHAVKDDIPADCLAAYRRLFNQGVGHFKRIIDSIIASADGAVSVPMQPSHIERYMTGWTFEYRPFSDPKSRSGSLEGFWKFDDERPNHVLIFYNQDAPPQRQRYSQVHELFHFIQAVDLPFLDLLDTLILDTTLPEKVIHKLLERLTERSTAMYLMPNKYFLKKYQEILAESPAFGNEGMHKLAEAFGVSVQAATYRLQECLRTTTLPQVHLGAMSP